MTFIVSIYRCEFWPNFIEVYFCYLLGNLKNYSIPGKRVTKSLMAKIRPLAFIVLTIH